MKASKLRNRIKFQRRTTTSDGYGNQLSDWADIAGLTAVPARIAPINGDESVIHSKLEGTGICEITVRASAAIFGVKTDDAIEDLTDGTRYNIRHIANRDERRRYLTFTCEYGVTDG